MNVIRECCNPDCLFRYPDIDSAHLKAYCPKCGGEAKVVAHIPERKASSPQDMPLKGFRSDFKAILDNIRSIYNVGSIFRTSDGFGVTELLLCGITPTPANPRFSKTSLGAENSVVWKYQPNAVKACRNLINDGFQIVALEIDEKSANLYEVDRKLTDRPLALVVGNEVAGIDPEILQMSDLIVSIPMVGYKNSYNVATSYGIAVSYFYALSVS